MLQFMQPYAWLSGARSHEVRVDNKRDGDAFRMNE